MVARSKGLGPEKDCAGREISLEGDYDITKRKQHD
jgi:hypothetical protein